METKTVILINLIAALVGVALITTIVMTPATQLRAEHKSTTVPEEIVNRFADWAKKFNKESILTGDVTVYEHRLNVYYENY